MSTLFYSNYSTSFSPNSAQFCALDKLDAHLKQVRDSYDGHQDFHHSNKVKELWSVEDHTAYMSIPLQHRNHIEFIAGISICGAMFDGSKSKKKDKTLSFILGASFPDSTCTGRVLPQYLPPFVVSAPQPAFTRPSSYTVEDKKFLDKVYLQKHIDKVAEDLQHSLNTHLGINMPIRQEQVARAVIDNLFPQEAQYLEHQMFTAYIDYIDQFKEYGIDDKNQLNHIMLIAAAAFPPAYIAAKGQSKVFAKLCLGTKLGKKVMNRRAEFEGIVEKRRQELQNTSIISLSGCTGDIMKGITGISNNTSNSSSSNSNRNTGHSLDDRVQTTNNINMTRDDRLAQSDNFAEYSSDSSSESSSDAQRDDDSVNIQDSTDTPIIAVIGNAVKKRKIPVAKIPNPFFSLFKAFKRKKRLGYISYAIVREFCHNTPEYARLDTALLPNGKQIECPDTHQVTLHKLLVRQMSNMDAYEKLFLTSQLYKDWQDQNSYMQYVDGVNIRKYPSIGWRAFQTRVCPCVIDPPLRSCANVPQVNFQQALESLLFLENLKSSKDARDSCDCVECKEQYLLKACKSIRIFEETCLCPAKVYEDLSSIPRDVGTQQDAEDANASYATTKSLERRDAASLSTVLMPIQRARIVGQYNKVVHTDFQGKFKISPRACGTGYCGDCGYLNLIGNDMCRAVIESNSSSLIKVKRFADIPRGSGMQSEVFLLICRFVFLISSQFNFCYTIRSFTIK